MKERGEGEVGGMKRSRKRGKGEEGRVGERISAQKDKNKAIYNTHSPKSSKKTSRESREKHCMVQRADITFSPLSSAA